MDTVQVICGIAAFAVAAFALIYGIICAAGLKKPGKKLTDAYTKDSASAWTRRTGISTIVSGLSCVLLGLSIMKVINIPEYVAMLPGIIVYAAVQATKGSVLKEK